MPWCSSNKLWGSPSLYGLSFLFEPFLLLLSGVMMVDIFRAQCQRLQDIEQQFARTTSEREQLTDQNKLLMEQNIFLEKQLVEDGMPMTKICATLTQVWKKAGTSDYQAILRLIMQITEAQSCAVYWGSAMQQRASQSKSDFEFPLLLNSDDAVVRTALERRQLCTIRDVLGEKHAVAQDSVVIAGPLVDCNQQVMGMVVIGTMPFSKFTASTFAFRVRFSKWYQLRWRRPCHYLRRHCRHQARG